MDTVFYQLLTSRQVTLVNMIIGAAAFVLLLILLFGKNSRDERGRKIIGKASIVGVPESEPASRKPHLPLQFYFQQLRYENQGRG